MCFFNISEHGLDAESKDCLLLLLLVAGIISRNEQYVYNMHVYMYVLSSHLCFVTSSIQQTHTQQASVKAFSKDQAGYISLHSETHTQVFVTVTLQHFIIPLLRQASCLIPINTIQVTPQKSLHESTQNVPCCPPRPLHSGLLDKNIVLHFLLK